MTAALRFRNTLKDLCGIEAKANNIWSTAAPRS